MRTPVLNIMYIPEAIVSRLVFFLPYLFHDLVDRVLTLFSEVYNPKVIYWLCRKL